MAWVERPGVIVGVDRETTVEVAGYMTEQLSERFPGVAFAIIPGVTTAVVFPWFEEVDDDESVRPE